MTQNTDKIPKINIAEFVEKGYLQEANRQFFHPLGLALAVITNADGTMALDSVWDYRGDLEGMMFTPDELEPAKFEHIKSEWVLRQIYRRARMGWMTQPIGGNDNADNG